MTDTKSLDPNADLADAMEFLHKNTSFPTFEEFKANPDKYRARPDELFESIDALNVEWKERVSSVKYYWRGIYECKTLHRIYDIAMNEGYQGSDLEMEPIAEAMDGTSNNHLTRVSVRVNVWPKEEFKASGGVVANG